MDLFHLIRRTKGICYVQVMRAQLCTNFTIYIDKKNTHIYFKVVVQIEVNRKFRIIYRFALSNYLIIHKIENIIF